MGLFDGGAKKEAAENAILQALSQLPILDDLVSTLMNNEEEWITNCQGYYDNRKRQVTIEADLFEIKWSSFYYEDERRMEQINGQVRYDYTSSGYTPLHNHVNEKGKEDVSVDRVIFLWSSIVRERLQAKMPNCKFGNVTGHEGSATFSYTVPALTWKRWF